MSSNIARGENLHINEIAEIMGSRGYLNFEDLLSDLFSHAKGSDLDFLVTMFTDMFDNQTAVLLLYNYDKIIYSLMKAAPIKYTHALYDKYKIIHENVFTYKIPCSLIWQVRRPEEAPDKICYTAAVLNKMHKSGLDIEFDPEKALMHILSLVITRRPKEIDVDLEKLTIARSYFGIAPDITTSGKLCVLATHKFVSEAHCEEFLRNVDDIDSMCFYALENRYLSWAYYLIKRGAKGFSKIEIESTDQESQLCRYIINIHNDPNPDADVSYDKHLVEKVGNEISYIFTGILGEKHPFYPNGSLHGTFLSIEDMPLKNYEIKDKVYMGLPEYKWDIEDTESAKDEPDVLEKFQEVYECSGWLQKILDHSIYKSARFNIEPSEYLSVYTTPSSRERRMATDIYFEYNALIRFGGPLMGKPVRLGLFNDLIVDYSIPVSDASESTDKHEGDKPANLCKSALKICEGSDSNDDNEFSEGSSEESCDESSEDAIEKKPYVKGKQKKEYKCERVSDIMGEPLKDESEDKSDTESDTESEEYSSDDSYESEEMMGKTRTGQPDVAIGIKKNSPKVAASAERKKSINKKVRAVKKMVVGKQKSKNQRRKSCKPGSEESMSEESA
jgi:hypothetical protein